MANILQAVEWMKEGKKVKHSDWIDRSYMYYSLDTYDFRNSKGKPFELSPGDFIAEWEIYTEEKNISNKKYYEGMFGSLKHNIFLMLGQIEGNIEYAEGADISRQLEFIEKRCKDIRIRFAECVEDEHE